MPNPLSAFKAALLDTPSPSSVRVGGRDIDFHRMPPSGPDGTPGPRRDAEVDDRIREALDSEEYNQDVFRRTLEPFPDDPGFPADPDVSGSLAIEWAEDPVSGEVVGKTSVADLDAEAYGLENAGNIRRELNRRASGAPMMDQSMPQFYPDADDPLRHYDRDILVVNDWSSHTEADLGASPAAFDPANQQMILKYEEANPRIVRHEQGHAATEGLGIGEEQKSDSNWLSMGSENQFHPMDLKSREARYLTDIQEMKPYLRDLKYQNYYGLADGSVEPNMKRPFFANLLDQTEAEGQDFHRLMEETKAGEATDVDVANLTLPALREMVADSYTKMTPEHQARLRMLWAMLSLSPIAMAEGEGDGSD